MEKKIIIFHERGTVGVGVPLMENVMKFKTNKQQKISSLYKTNCITQRLLLNLDLYISYFAKLAYFSFSEIWQFLKEVGRRILN